MIKRQYFILFNMKYCLFYIIILLLLNNCNKNECENFEGEFYKKDWFYILNLPYNINDDIEYVFDKSTPMAIDLIYLYADGRKVNRTDRRLIFIDPHNNFYIHKVNKENNENYISMFWISLASDEKKMIWYDGIAHFYQVTRNVKTLKIKYRILLPHENITIEDLYLRNNENLKYSEEYIISVDLKKLWDSEAK